MEKQTIWVIDEDENQCKTYVNVLQDLLPKDLDIKGINPPFQTVYEYTKLLSNPLSACFMIDQKLKDTGVANYYGIDLATFLRGINTKIPIFILTNFSEEKESFSEGEWSVDDIIPKSLLRPDLEKTKTYIARITRRLLTYTDYLSSRAERFNELLHKSLTGEMTAEDEDELNNIQFERTSSLLAEELPKLQELNKILSELKRIEKNQWDS